MRLTNDKVGMAVLALGIFLAFVMATGKLSLPISIIGMVIASIFIIRGPHFAALPEGYGGGGR